MKDKEFQKQLVPFKTQMMSDEQYLELEKQVEEMYAENIKALQSIYAKTRWKFCAGDTVEHNKAKFLITERQLLVCKGKVPKLNYLGHKYFLKNNKPVIYRDHFESVLQDDATKIDTDDKHISNSKN